jgi:hypothetical protein
MADAAISVGPRFALGGKRCRLADAINQILGNLLVTLALTVRDPFVSDRVKTVGVGRCSSHRASSIGIHLDIFAIREKCELRVMRYSPTGRIA